MPEQAFRFVKKKRITATQLSRSQQCSCHRNVQRHGQPWHLAGTMAANVFGVALGLGYFAVADKTQRAHAHSPRHGHGYLRRLLRRELSPWRSPSPASSSPRPPPASASPRLACASARATSPSLPAPAVTAPPSLPARPLAPPRPRRRRRWRRRRWSRGRGSSRRTSRGTTRPTTCARSSRSTAPSSALR